PVSLMHGCSRPNDGRLLRNGIRRASKSSIVSPSCRTQQWGWSSERPMPSILNDIQTVLSPPARLPIVGCTSWTKVATLSERRNSASRSQNVLEVAWGDCEQIVADSTLIWTPLAWMSSLWNQSPAGG